MENSGDLVWMCFYPSSRNQISKKLQRLNSKRTIFRIKLHVVFFQDIETAVQVFDMTFLF